MTQDITLEIGSKAPNFSAADHSGLNYSLDDLIGEGKTIVLYFYPKDNTPGCTIQACDFRDNISILQSKDIIVLGVSKDSASSHEKFVSKYDLNFPLLIDTDLSIHKSYGVWQEKINYGKKYMGTVRSTFVIGPDGTLEWLGYNVKAKGHVEKLMHELSIK